MACFSFPKSFYNRINKAIRNFWWKGDLIHKGILWANWASMCHSKLFGGLGFRDFSAFNQAMLAKQGWRLLSNPHSYWAQILKDCIFHIPLSSTPLAELKPLGHGIACLRGGLFFPKDFGGKSKMGNLFGFGKISGS